jgi:hypothetical protein
MLALAVIVFLSATPGRDVHLRRAGSVKSGAVASVQEIPRIVIRSGRGIEVDGVNSAGEWTDADSVMIHGGVIVAVTVHFKHDGANLLFAFTGFSNRVTRVPEVLIDVNNTKELVWEQDHWWFHASGSDCWSSGRYNAYDTCVLETPAWQANNPHPPVEMFELSIPLATIGLTAGSDTVVGIAFDVTDTSREWDMWPAGAQLGVPSSGGEGVIEGEGRRQK